MYILVRYRAIHLFYVVQLGGVVGLSLTFGELEAMLAQLHRVASDRRTAFQARLKNFHRLEFPKNDGPGRGKLASPGRGKAATYHANEIVQFLCACELLQLGLTPERATEVVETDGYQVIIAMTVAADHLKRGETGEGGDLYLCLDPIALASLTRRRGGDDPSSETMFYRTASGLSELLVSERYSGRRLSVINFTALLSQAAHVLRDQQGVDPQVFADAILEWSSSFGWGYVDNGEVRIASPYGDS